MNSLTGKVAIVTGGGGGIGSATARLLASRGTSVTVAADDWDMVMAINLRGPMLGCKHPIPEVLKRGAGSIINTSAAAGILGDAHRNWDRRHPVRHLSKFHPRLSFSYAALGLAGA